MAAMSDLHALVFPFPAEGHINGLLRLAQALAAQGLTVTFGYPARFYSLATKRRKDPTAPLVHPSVRVEVLPDGLPTAEDEAPTSQQFLACIPILKDALKLLINKLTDTSSGSNTVPICCIISDTFVPWTQDMADEAGLPRIDFWTSTATVYSMGYHLPQLLSRGHLPVKGGGTQWTVEADLIDFIPGLPPFPVTELPHELLLETSHPRFQFMMEAFSRAREADTILVHSLHELESSVVDAMQADGINIYCVGPLFGFDPFSTESESGVAANKACFEWLDKQAVSSVIYVALGSFATLTSEETHALALGLEASGHQFLWVIRADSVEGTLSDTLPEGFLERTAGRSHVMSWAPQREVLKHAAVGAFFTHCGWNSTLESLWEGVPMVACPRAAEQRSNARSIVEFWRVGVEVERSVDGRVSKAGVEKALTSIMSDHSVHQRAKALQQTARRTVADGGISRLNLLNFVHRLQHRLRQ